MNDKPYCSKISYPSRADALQGAEDIRRTKLHFAKRCARLDSYKKFKAYQCPRCGQWHLTTQKQYKRKKR